MARSEASKAAQREITARWQKEHPERISAAVARWKEKHPERYLFNHTKTRAKAAGIPFNLTHEDIVIPEFCPLLGIELRVGKGKNGGPLPNSPSVDKIRPELGYVKGNVWVISHRANQIKSDATVEELERIALFLRKVTH